MAGLAAAYCFGGLPAPVTFQLYFNRSPSASIVPAADRVISNGTVPPCLLVEAVTVGLRLPALYSIRTSLALSLLPNQTLPYSNTYRSPSGPNFISIGSIGWYD